jgi:hypothetical protein
MQRTHSNYRTPGGCRRESGKELEKLVSPDGLASSPQEDAAVYALDRLSGKTQLAAGRSANVTPEPRRAHTDVE